MYWSVPRSEIMSKRQRWFGSVEWCTVAIKALRKQCRFCGILRSTLGKGPADRWLHSAYTQMRFQKKSAQKTVRAV